jgi:hypothetical protein
MLKEEQQPALAAAEEEEEKSSICAEVGQKDAISCCARLVLHAQNAEARREPLLHQATAHHGLACRIGLV